MTEKPHSARVPPPWLLRLAFEKIEAAVMDYRRILREWDSGLHDEDLEPNNKALSSREFYHG